MANEATSPARPHAEGPPEVPDERRIAAWIGKSLRIEGRIVSTDNLTINGHVEGTIEVGDNTLAIGPDAAVTADLAARSVTISGTVTGSVVAKERVDVHATGSVVGDITAPRLVLADGAVVLGKIDAGPRKAG
jgi:cytoskeletal protein CcmA (bactofilin family)